MCAYIFKRDKHRDKDREHREHRDKDKHHSSKSSHDRHKDRENKANNENGVAHIKSEPVAVIKEEQRDPLDTNNYSFSETNAIQANGIRECFVNVSQISEASSCDYSMSQFRADESQFSIKGEADDESQESAIFAADGNDMLDSQEDDDEDMPIAQRKKVKRELSDDDEDDMPLTARKKTKTEKKEKKIKREPSDDEDDYDKPKKKKIKKEKV